MLKNHSAHGIDMAKIDDLTISGSSASFLNAVSLKAYEEICIWENPRENYTTTLFSLPKGLFARHTSDIHLRLNVSVFAISHY
jgi:hypothetical protein